MQSSGNKGKVYLIGAGPGDPGLITIKGKECIERADVVIYDYLASPALLKYASPKAEVIYVGKKGGDHTLSQEGINALIVDKAKNGLSVARLKGGDPFIFGRGGEEAMELIAAGIAFEIVPGVTSAIAAPAYAGIPLTHRQFTSSVSIITGHEDPLKQESSIDWELIAKSTSTLVFLMGVKNLPQITQQLIRYGKPSDTPIAIVRWGTTPKQKSVQGTLETIVKIATEANIKSPSVIVVGGVVTLKDKMKWFENRPLFGKRIVVTRAREQASDLVYLLSELGADCIECPTIKVVPPEDHKPLDQAIDQIKSYTWIIFTSVNGVLFFFDKLFEKKLDVRVLGHLKTASIGPATAEKLLSYGIKSDIVPESYRAESVVEAFKKEHMNGESVLLPRAAEARPVLPVELRKMGAQVDEVKTYQTELVENSANTLLENLGTRTIDLITFTSSSTVKNLRTLIPDEKFEDLMEGITIACIGPITADTAKDLGFSVHIVAESYTIPGLCEAIERYYN
ncbi:MAG: uroporphyrinogen-III C-methyltransferase [Proteobacteria bacterium]|nr:uroporphyrinogen-III C-methyltransferase [Pseudomonadota bacterium]